VGKPTHPKIKIRTDKKMRKFRVSGIFTEYIYAETEEEAIEQFDEISADYASEPFDEVVCEEMPLSQEKI
jgi:hypothetical protein